MDIDEEDDESGSSESMSEENTGLLNRNVDLF
jgi:hypothetical protein